MTVSELIDQLSKLPQSLEVKVYAYPEGEHLPVKTASVEDVSPLENHTGVCVVLEVR